MESPSVLENQIPSPRKSSPHSTIIMTVLAVSLMGNAYFLFDRQNWLPSETVAVVPVPQVVATPVVHTTKKANDPQWPTRKISEESPKGSRVVAIASAPVEQAKKAVSVSATTLKKDKGSFQVQRASFIAPEEFPGHELQTLHFAVRKSLTFTLCQVMPDPDCKQMSAYMSRLLMWRMDVTRHLREGDRVSIVYERLSEKEMRILRLEFDSGFLKEKLVANFYQAPGADFGTYFDDAGKEFGLRLKDKQSPIRAYSEITSLPGDYREGAFAGHSGTDFKTAVGTPIYAAFGARVSRVNWNRHNNGLCVELTHPAEGVRTLYLHLNKVRVKKGQYVKAGEIIGEAGNTGHSFAPHLHYEMRSLKNRNKILNPFKTRLHPTFRRTVNSMTGFKKSAGRYASILQNSLS